MIPSAVPVLTSSHDPRSTSLRAGSPLRSPRCSGQAPVRPRRHAGTAMPCPYMGLGGKGGRPGKASPPRTGCRALPARNAGSPHKPGQSAALRNRRADSAPQSAATGRFSFPCPHAIVLAAGGFFYVSQ